MACEVYGPLRAIDNTPGYAAFARLLHYLVVVVVVLAGRERSRAVGLGAATVYTSVFYCPIFATPEAAPPFIPLAALALVLLAKGIADYELRITNYELRFMFLFTLLALVASLFSYSQHDSLAWSFKLLTLLIFTFTIPLTIRTPAHWKHTALLVVVVSVAIPVLLSAAKLIDLTWQLGVWPAAQYRLGLTELGRANLIVRTLMVGFPVVLALSQTSVRKVGWWWILTALTLLVFVACQSWGGWVGVFWTIIIVLATVRGDKIAGVLQRHRLMACALTMLTVIGLLGLVWLAAQSNITSFNGRLIHFRIAFDQIVHHPLFGVGPGHYFMNAHYTGSVNWLADNQYSLDNPLWVISLLPIFPLLHSHNLFLEVAAGIGIPGLIMLVWFLIQLLRSAVGLLSHLSDNQRTLLLGCIAGIVASLGWGLLDVMEISSPFFTFPTWALVGLLLAATRAFGTGRQGDKGNATCASRITFHASRFTFYVLCLGFILVAIVLSLLGNTRYRAAYTAYQERRWTIVVSELTQASRWEPLNAKYHQLRGEALINLGRYDEAISAYERAVRLKRDFAPYHAQLGWLYWLQGDLEQATAHFQKAVEMDPREAWRDGLHADLGMANVRIANSEFTNGDVEKAFRLFKETIELDPQMALAPYWVPVQRSDGRFDVVLDQVYLSGASPELNKRILTHLGKADYTPRLFSPSPPHPLTPSPPLSFSRVLDVIEADYEAARAEDSREAPRLLATVAEAARLVGLHDRAERAYLEFQDFQLDSAYGFRDLGTLYHEQGRLDEAQAMLERAVEVSPRDTASWLGLAEVYLEQGSEGAGERALDAVYRLSPLNVRLYELRARLYQGQGDLGRAADALRKSLVIRESVPNRLALADLYRQLEQPQSATEQCLAAADALLRTWPRPLDPELWNIGACLAQSDEGNLPVEITALAREHPLVGNVLLGHTYRAQGHLEQALTVYQSAADARPDEGAPHYFLGETYQALGQPESAEAAYRWAAQLDPLESLPLLALGQMEWGQGEHEAALATFRAAVEVTPGWGQARVALGNALLATGDRDGAAEHYQLAQIADGDVREGVVYDFAARLAEAEIQSPGADYVRNDYFTINGDRRRVLFAHPDSRVSYRLSLPASPLVSEGTEGGRLTLAFAVATAPESWDQPGDGVAFAVYVESGQGTQQVFSTYIDPKQDETARRWHPYAIDLSAYAGQAVTLIFETDTGPAGDERYDWAGWGEPRMLGP